MSQVYRTEWFVLWMGHVTGKLSEINNSIQISDGH